MFVTWYGNQFECNKAVKLDDQVIMYDSNNNVVHQIINLQFVDWENISIDGEWSEPLPPLEEQNRADIDYIALMSGIDLEV